MYEWIAKWTKNERMIQTASRLLRRMPRPFIVVLCHLLGLWIYAGAVSVRKKIRENLVRFLPELSTEQIRRYSRRFFQYGVFMLYEILVDVPSEPVGNHPRFTVEGEAHLLRALEQGKGAILFTPHLGNYFYYYWYFSQRYPCLTVVTASSEILRPLYLRMQSFGCEGLDYDHTPPLKLLRELRQHLRGGGIVLLLGDFWRPNFPPASMFGSRTRSPRGAAKLALEEQVPVIPFYGYRKQGFGHHVVIEPPIYLHEHFEPGQTLQATNWLNRFLERAIRICPEQWFYWFDADRRFEMDNDLPVNDVSSLEKAKGQPVARQ